MCGSRFFALLTRHKVTKKRNTTKSFELFCTIILVFYEKGHCSPWKWFHPSHCHFVMIFPRIIFLLNAHFWRALTSQEQHEPYFCNITLTIFGTILFASRKKVKKNLHTYITPYSLLIYWMLHHVGSLHKIKSTYINRQLLQLYQGIKQAIFLFLNAFSLTFQKWKNYFSL